MVWLCLIGTYWAVLNIFLDLVYLWVDVVKELVYITSSIDETTLNDEICPYYAIMVPIGHFYLGVDIWNERGYTSSKWIKHYPIMRNIISNLDISMTNGAIAPYSFLLDHIKHFNLCSLFGSRCVKEWVYISSNMNKTMINNVNGLYWAILGQIDHFNIFFIGSRYIKRTRIY